jgi:hypothetical protein
MKTLKILIFFLLWHTTMLHGQGDSNLPNTAQSFLKSFADAAPPPSSASSCDIFQRFTEELEQHPNVFNNSNDRVDAWETLFSSPTLRLDVKWLDAIIEWKRAGLTISDLGNGEFEILMGATKIGLITNGTLLSTRYMSGAISSPSTNIGPIINGCQIVRHNGQLRIIRIPYISHYDADELGWLNGPGAHSLERHGPDVTDEALKHRALTGRTPDGQQNGIVNSTKFDSPEKLKYALEQVRPGKPGPPGSPQFLKVHCLLLILIL